MNRLSHQTRRSTVRHLAAIAAALTLGIAGVAAAQPARHGGGPDGFIAHMLQSAKARLNLDTSQQVAWDSAVASTKAAHEASRANRQRVRDTLQSELAKAEPDLAAVAAVADDVEQQNRAQRIKVRNDWLTLYATLSPEQKGIVRDNVAQRLTRMQQWREHMHERFLQHHGQGANG